jgi:hypothetical protein
MIRIKVRNRSGTLRTDFGARAAGWKMEQFVNSKVMAARREELLWGAGWTDLSGYVEFQLAAMRESHR